MALIINNLSFKYNKSDKKYALEDINLTLEDNKIYGIIGKCGSGKTTFIELIDGVLKPTKGSIKLDNKKLLKSDVGLVFQFPEDEIFNLTVYDEISYALKNFKKKDINILEILKFANIDESILNKKINELSNAEKRLVAIISSIVYNPKIILLDEPTINLDYNNKKKILMLIRNLKTKYNKTIFVISHDVDMLYEICDKVIVLSNGKLKYFGDFLEYGMNNSTLVPNVIKFEKLAYKKGIKLMNTNSVNDLIKEVYRNV